MDGKTIAGSEQGELQDTGSDSAREGDEQVEERIPKKKKPTPENSAEAAMQPCPSQ